MARYFQHISLNLRNSLAEPWEPGDYSSCLPRFQTHLLWDEKVTLTAAQTALLTRGFSAGLGQTDSAI